MPKRKILSGERLIKTVALDTPSKEIMDLFGLKSSGQLKAVYLDALVKRPVCPY